MQDTRYKIQSEPFASVILSGAKNLIFTLRTGLSAAKNLYEALLRVHND
jgi:hypothetical protein